MSSLGNEIYRTHDALGPIAVYQDGERRILTFGSAVEQSCIWLPDPVRLEYAYTQAMFLATLLGPLPSRALMLGLGGGSLVRALRHRHPRCRVTAVEARDKVATIARDYFYLPGDTRLELVIADAGALLAARGPQSQDFVFVDLYLAEGLSPQQTGRPFLEACRAALSPRGVLILNLWGSDYQGTRESLQRTREIFDEQVLMLQVQGGNIVLFAFAAGLPELQRKRFFADAQILGLEMRIPLQRIARNLWRQNAEALQLGRFRRSPLALGAGSAG